MSEGASVGTTVNDCDAIWHGDGKGCAQVSEGASMGTFVNNCD